VTFVHSQPLLSNTTFTVQVQGVRDLAGNLMTKVFSSSFTTSSTLDTSALQIVSTNPVDGATSAPTTTNVAATFGEAIDPSTLTTASFIVADYNSTNLPLPGTVQVDATGTIATFVPSQPFPSGHAFLVTLTTAIKDLAGNGLAASFVFGFSTGAVGPGEVDTVFSVLNTSLGAQPTAMETNAAPFSVLNTSSGAQPTTVEADAATFSVLNTSSGAQPASTEVDAAPFSVLNTSSGAQPTLVEADGVPFSVLNTSSGAQATFMEADTIMFSVQNNATASMDRKAGRVIHPSPPIDSDGDGYPDDLETTLGSDPNDPSSVPKVQPPPEADAIAFTVMNLARPATQASSTPQEQKGQTHVAKVSHSRPLDILERIFGFYRSAGSYTLRWLAAP
jgi:hypothetical protein